MPDQIIAPSILASDFANLQLDVRGVTDAGAEWVHIDVMDNRFVPNLTIGPCVVQSLRKGTDKFLDVHIMVEKPWEYAEPFAKAGADLVTFHVEAVVPEACRTYREKGWVPIDTATNRKLAAEKAREVIQLYRQQGLHVGIALNPETSAGWVEPVAGKVDLLLAMTVWPGFGGQAFISDVMPKVTELRHMVGPNAHIQVDGGIKLNTIQEAATAGANVYVAGTAVFHSDDPASVIQDMLANARSALSATLSR